MPYQPTRICPWYTHMPYTNFVLMYNPLPLLYYATCILCTQPADVCTYHVQSLPLSLQNKYHCRTNVQISDCTKLQIAAESKPTCLTLPLVKIMLFTLPSVQTVSILDALQLTHHTEGRGMTHLTSNYFHHKHFYNAHYLHSFQHYRYWQCSLKVFPFC